MIYLARSQTNDEYSNIGRIIVMYRCRVANGLLNFLLHCLIKPNIEETVDITPDICKLKNIYLPKIIPKSVVCSGFLLVCY